MVQPERCRSLTEQFHTAFFYILYFSDSEIVTVVPRRLAIHTIETNPQHFWHNERPIHKILLKVISQLILQQSKGRNTKTKHVTQICALYLLLYKIPILIGALLPPFQKCNRTPFQQVINIGRLPGLPYQPHSAGHT